MMAMPCEYVSDSRKPRLRLVWAPSPTMIEDRIGTIGNTQGVNDRPRPSSRNIGRITSNWRPCSAAFQRLSSLAGDRAGVTAIAGAGAGMSVAVGFGMV